MGKFQGAVLDQVDVIVLGAGIVGVSTAAHLRRRGLDVALIDRRHPGEETSFGNAGIIQRSGFAPIPIPTRPGVLLDILLKQSSAASYDLGTLIRQIPWLRQYQKFGQPEAIQHYAQVMADLKPLAVEEHRTLARASNAERFYRKSGWLRIFRSRASYDGDELERRNARIFGVEYRPLVEGDINTVEPGLKTDGLYGDFWPESESVSSPGAVTDAIWRSFIQDGGLFLKGDANKLERRRNKWHLQAERGEVSAGQAVVALGPWANDFLQTMDESYPMAVKRGYHTHFRPASGGSLLRPVVDMDNGFVLTSMDQGIRLTTGVEFAERDAPPTGHQIKLARKRANEIFPLGRPVEKTPWLGSRPCMPDSLPVVGRSPKTKGLWLNFGHGHEGFTIGPLCGRIMAEMILGDEPCIDPAPMSPLRFVS